MSKEIIVERGTKTVYREGSKIVKQFKAGYPKSAVIKEAFNHALAEESGLNVPALLEVKNTGEGWALVIEAVEGKTMAQLMAEQPENLEALMTQFVEIQSDIHRRTCKQMGRLKDKLNAQISSLRDELDASTRYELHVRLENMKPHTKITHGDFNPTNVLIGEDGKVHIRAGASCIGQGLGTVLVQLVVTNAKLTRDQVVYDGNSTFITPDSGDTSGSRQTLITGEACRRACEKFTAALEGHTMKDLNGQEFYGEYYAKTDPLGADKPNPVSHVAYGYATQMCILDKKTGKLEKIVAAHDVGKAVNPRSCEGQIEGGVVMSMGYALREQYPIDENCKPIDKYGKLGLFRAHEIPEIEAIVIDKPGLSVACGAIGIGEITSIPTAPAIAEAYYQYDHERRTVLPLVHTPYERKW